MKFTGKNLELITRAVELALGELRNQIGTCPDVFLYADLLEDLEAEHVTYTALLKRLQA